MSKRSFSLFFLMFFERFFGYELWSADKGAVVAPELFFPL